MAVLPFDEEQIRTYREYRRQYGWVYRVVGGLLLILFGIWLGSQLFAGDNGYQTNLYTEALSIAVTVFVLNELAKRRDAQKWFAQLRRQMGSNDHGLTQQAVRELAATNWMYDGSLRGCYFTSANLEDATMLHADLEATYFTGANLRGASLPYAKLQKARLQFADFEGATLWNADLREVHAIGANFQNASLAGANLQGAYLVRAKLRGCLFYEDIDDEYIAKFDDKTVLPDRTKYDPALGLEQLERFTNPAHPDFRDDWRV